MLNKINWKSFKYNEIFEIKNWKRVIIDEIKDNNWKYNFVSAIDYNNWVFCKTNMLPNHKAWAIAVNYDWNWVAEAYYQDEDFWALDSVNVLYPKFKINIYSWLFVCSLIRKEKYRFSYGRKWNTERMKNSIIKLPINNKWEIDLMFMEDYVKNLDKENLIFKNYKVRLNNKKENIDYIKWSYFEYSELFDLEKWKWPSSNFAENNPWKTPFISATRENNWVSYLVDYQAKHKWNIITVPSNWNSVWEAYYQEKEFCSTWDVNILIPKFKLNKYIWIFISTMIRKDKYRYNYWRKWWLDKMKTSKIKLPVNDLWEPHFEFMENYIKSLPYSKYL